MNLTELRSLARTKVPDAPTAVISNANQLIIFNNGCTDFARKTKCLPKYNQFDTVADRAEYNLSTLLTDYLVPLSNGVYWYDSSNTKYDRLDAITREYLDAYWSNWLTADAGDPQRCFIQGDKLTLHPADDAATTNGILMYYAAKPTAMSTGTHYPFGGSSEISYLSSYHTLIIDYYEWQAYEILDRNEPGSPRLSRAKLNYKTNLAEARIELKQYVTEFIGRGPKTRLKTSDYAQNPF